ncbi:hypothetical protein DSECCO2_486450 [anaerobic digester metagenome]
MSPFTTINFRIVPDLKTEKRVENRAGFSASPVFLFLINTRGNRENRTAAKDAYKESW